MRKSLAEMIGSGGFQLPHVEGIVDVVLKNEDGSIADHVHQKNMVLEFYRMLFYGTDIDLSTMYLFIGSNSEPMHPKRNSFRNLIPSPFSVNLAPTFDGPNRLWTYFNTFSAPAANRTFRTVGLGKNSTGATNSNANRGIVQVCAATVLGTPITQTTSQTLEVTYRLAFQRV